MKIFMASTLVVGVLFLLSIGVASMKSGQTIVLNGKTMDTSRVESEDVEREVRTGLPVGSSLATVTDFLNKQHIEHSYDASSRTVYAAVKKLKGGSVIAKKSLTMQFRFSDTMMLNSIETKTTYTGL